MREQYYKRVWVGDESIAHLHYQPVDIGWRFCKDELPSELGYYPIIWDEDSDGMAFWNGKEWKACTFHVCIDEIVQWYKMEERLTEK